MSASSARVAAGMSAEAARGPGRREALDGELGVEQPQREVLAADPGPQRTRIDPVLDLGLDHQRGLVEPAGPDPQPAPSPLVELAGPHGVGGGVDDDRHPRPQRPNVLPQNAFRPIGQDEGAPHEAAQRAHQRRADQPRQLGELRPQIQREEVRHEGDHAQRRSAWAEAAYVGRNEDHHDEQDIADHRVRRTSAAAVIASAVGSGSSAMVIRLSTRIGFVHRARRDHRDQRPEQRHRQRLAGGFGQQEQGQQRRRQRAGRAGGHPQPQQAGIRSDRPVTRPLVQRGCVTEHP